MPIETSRTGPGVLVAKSIGQTNFSDMSESRAIGMRLLEEAGDKEWVLIMDLTESRAPAGRAAQNNDMNVDSLRGVTQKNKETNLVGYVVLGANAAVKMIMRTYGVVFRIDIYFETTFEGACSLANKLLAKHRGEAT